MMWKKTGPGSYKASNGSGFEADVFDRGHYFSVRIGDDRRIVGGESLDALKLAVTRIAISKAQSLEVAS